MTVLKRMYPRCEHPLGELKKEISRNLYNYILSIFGCPYLLNNNYVNYTIAISAIIYYLKTDCRKFQKLFVLGMSADLNDFIK